MDTLGWVLVALWVLSVVALGGLISTSMGVTSTARRESSDETAAQPQAIPAGPATEKPEPEGSTA
jgi:hypothetical protein